jgi:hypothetical protein
MPGPLLEGVVDVEVFRDDVVRQQVLAVAFGEFDQVLVIEFGLLRPVGEVADLEVVEVVDDTVDALLFGTADIDPRELFAQVVEFVGLQRFQRVGGFDARGHHPLDHFVFGAGDRQVLVSQDIAAPSDGDVLPQQLAGLVAQVDAENLLHPVLEFLGQDHRSVVLDAIAVKDNALPLEVQ